MFFKKALSLVLIFFLLVPNLLLAIPASVFAAQGDTISQTENYKITEEETGVRYKVDTGGNKPLYYKAQDGVWRDRDTTLESSQDPTFFKQAIKNQFHVFFQEKFNQGNLIRYKYDQEFEGKGKAQVDLQPGKLEWIEDGGNKHSIIDNPNNVTGTFAGNKATYTGGYGTGLDMEYEVTASKVKKKLIVQTNTALPTPPLKHTKWHQPFP